MSKPSVRMIFFLLETVINEAVLIRREANMENTNEFVTKLNDNQKKQEKNKKTHGKGHPERQLPNKQH